jgi:hypothetical protein
MLGTYHGVTKKLGKRIDPGTGKKLKIKKQSSTNTQ